MLKTTTTTTTNTNTNTTTTTTTTNTKTISWLVQNLCTADARNADLEEQNKSLVEQLWINKEACDALAQRCRLAEEKNDLLNLTATRSLAEQSEKHKKEGGVLWELYTLEIGDARRALEAEKAAHRLTLEAGSMRGVRGAPQTAAFAARELALLAKINAIEALYVAQRNALKSQDHAHAGGGCASRPAGGAAAGVPGAGGRVLGRTRRQREARGPLSRGVGALHSEV
jgi:hypothetical protein